MTENDETFLSYDRLKLNGTYKKPVGKLRAAVLLVHGITSDRNEMGFYSGMASSLAEADIATLRFDYRCHGVEKTPMNQLTLSGIVNDINAAFTRLEEIVGSQISKYIVGTSFGGGLSAYWAAHNPKAIKALFLCAPVIDYEYDVLRRVGLLESDILSEEGKMALDKNGYIESDTIHFGQPLINELLYINGIKALASLSCKIMIFHGDADTDVPISSSQRYCTRENCSIYVIKGAEHGFSVPNDETLSHPLTKANHQMVYMRIREAVQQF